MHPYGPPPKKNGAKTALIVGAVLTGLCVLGSIIAAVRGTGTPAAKTSAPAGHQVRFEATAQSGRLTMVNWSILEDASVETDPTSPWTKTVTLETAAGLVGINASGTGTVTCRLLVDGKVVDEGSSEGTVNCSRVLSS